MTRTFRATFWAGGSGFGARGFEQATAKLGDASARFENGGSIDIDELACQDFERLTSGKAMKADLHTVTVARLREHFGEEAPDIGFGSSPCKGYSALLSKAASEREEYQLLNLLFLKTCMLLTSTWQRGAKGRGLPGLILMENVPRIRTRGAEILQKTRQLLHSLGYVFHESAHDCGEVGGLAQHRPRYLFIARHPDRVPAFMHRPPKLPVRACGSELGPLLFPNDPAAGPMHRLPEISWLNWVRLALIPAGGDWRDLPRAITTQPENPNAHRNKHQVADWKEPVGVVMGATRPGSGAPSVADERVALPESESRFNGQGSVQDWKAPAQAVTASRANGAINVADERLALGKTAENAGRWKDRPGLMGVQGWDEPAPAVTATMEVSGGHGTAAVSDPRVPLAEQRPRPGAMGVLDWKEPAGVVTGHLRGPAAIADPRELPEGYRFYTVEEALAFVKTGREKPPKGVVPVILNPHDNCWHRPLTTLELAVLQSAPPTIDGKPLVLAGTAAGSWRERIGNAVPEKAAKAIGNSSLKALLASALGTWSLSSDGIWVRNDGMREYETEARFRRRLAREQARCPFTHDTFEDGR